MVLQETNVWSLLGIQVWIGSFKLDRNEQDEHYIRTKSHKLIALKVLG